MKTIISVSVVVFLFLFSGKVNSQVSSKCKEIEWKNGSEAAKKIMKSNFYYDALDSWSPFGSDMGHDAYYSYCHWKKEHLNKDIRKFMESELIDLGYPGFDLALTSNDSEKLKEIVNSMPNQYVELNAINNTVISLAFAQLFLEGKVDPKVKEWAEAAFSRESMYLEFWDSDKERMKEREERMIQLLNDLRKSKS
ncbi:hypothetical protein SD427_18890 (plasmid) [Chryseobacterium sp. JJR-5R]|uniref:hypothetical protein n=1 Tax=Chryseobacterium sp. JJR-5R TaxID=3093923 RepID=UPI002A74F5E1|nr:hypothetical protein [Chryseobacterium sp. JJR-5R]WPO84596.1 hypothetical protein SD427_18890 [Chryseobacterium sp. JJR-5R]